MVSPCRGVARRRSCLDRVFDATLAAPLWNSGCGDCAAVTNGNKTVDACGRCLLPADPLYNGTCTDCAGPRSRRHRLSLYRLSVSPSPLSLCLRTPLCIMRLVPPPPPLPLAGA